MTSPALALSAVALLSLGFASAAPASAAFLAAAGDGPARAVVADTAGARVAPPPRRAATPVRVTPVSRAETALEALGRHVRRKSHPDALRLAFQAFYNYRSANPGKVRKPYLYFVDYGLDSQTPRGYLFDMDALRLVDGPFAVAHGRGSAGRDGVPTRFSNRHGSNATSLGLFLAQETYPFRGKSGGVAYRSLGLRLKGLSGKYNDAARGRGVVVHGAPYVTSQRAGRSEGCPAVEQDRAEQLITRIRDGGLVFLFSPLDPEWLQGEPWAHGRGRG